MENISKYINWKSNQIKNSKEQSFAALFDLIHNQEDRIFAEYFDMLQVRVVSYKECKSYIKKTANYLKSQLTAPKNSFVGILMENSMEWVGTFWGLLMIGYKPLLINCKLPSNINKDVVATMKCTEVVATKEFAHQDLNAKTIVLDQNNIETSNELSEATWADEIAMCTTASSLNYKICVYGGQNMFAQLSVAEYVIRKYCPDIKKHYKHRLKLLAFLPFYHIFGLIATYLWFALYGRTIVFLKDYSADTIINTIQSFEVTHIFSVPLFWNSIAKQINKEIDRMGPKTKKKFIKGQKLSYKLQNLNAHFGIKCARKIFKQIIDRTLGKSIKYLISGGGYQSDSTIKLFSSLGYPISIGYGTSEIGIICFDTRHKPKYNLLGTCGKPLNTVEVKIQDGSLWVRGLSTCKYFYYKDGTKVDLNGNWFNTYDIASIDKKGYISILGRLDDVIVGETGEKINPDLIEKKLILPSVLNYVILPVNNKTSLIVQIKNNLNSLDINKIVDEVNQNIKQLSLEGYSIESLYYTLDPLAPKNAIKVSRRILKTQLSNNQIKLIPFNDLKPHTEVNQEDINNQFVKQIKTIVADVLNKPIEQINSNQHLIFDLSATSLDYFTIMIRLENEFDIKFEFKENSCQTINDFANYIIKTKKGVK